MGGALLASFFKMLLLKIRGKTISYATYKKKMEIQKEADLIKQIEQLEGEGDLDAYSLHQLKNSKAELQDIRNKRVEGMAQSKVAKGW